MTPAEMLKAAAIRSKAGEASMQIGGWSFILTTPGHRPPAWTLAAAKRLGAKEGAELLSEWLLSAKRLDGGEPSAGNLAFARRFASLVGAPEGSERRYVVGSWYWQWAQTPAAS